MLYNVPGRTAVDLTTATIKRLVEDCKNINCYEKQFVPKTLKIFYTKKRAKSIPESCPNLPLAFRPSPIFLKLQPLPL